MKAKYEHRYGRARAESLREKAFITPLSKRKDLIRLDTNAIRRKELGTYHHTEKKLKELKNQLKHYHEHDIPEFRTWIHKTFGQLLTRQREIASAIEDKNRLLFEVEDYADIHFVSTIEAYKKVLWRREHPDEAIEEDRVFEEERAKRRKKLKDDLNENNNPWLADDNPGDPFGDFADFDSIPDEEWNDFSEYFEEITGQKPPPRNPRTHPQHAHPDDRTAKKVYRTIVRRLHPDHHGQMTETRQNLWHEAQSAYRNRDINALYGILSRCDESETGIGNHTPVSLIQRLTKQLKKSTGALRNEIRKMKSDHAWKFEERARNPGFVSQLRRELEEVVYIHEMELRHIGGIISQLEKEAAKTARPHNRPKPTSRRHPPNLESDLWF